MRASQVLQLLKMANSPIDGMCNIEENIIKFRGVIAHLRKYKGANTKNLYTVVQIQWGNILATNLSFILCQ